MSILSRRSRRHPGPRHAPSLRPVRAVTPEPRGLARPEVLAAILGQAEAETRAARRPPWAEDINPRDWYGWDLTTPDDPPPHDRPYVPAPAAPAAPPPPSCAADYRDLRVYPAVVRGACAAGLRGIGVRQHAAIPAPPDFALGAMMREHFEGMAAMAAIPAAREVTA